MIKSYKIVLIEVGGRSIIVELPDLSTHLRLEIMFIMTPVCPAVCGYFPEHIVIGTTEKADE